MLPMEYHLSHMIYQHVFLFLFFVFKITAITEIYTLSLHDALPIYQGRYSTCITAGSATKTTTAHRRDETGKTGVSHLIADRKSTRLNSSHLGISYAVFCLKKKTTQTTITSPKRENREKSYCSKSHN